MSPLITTYTTGDVICTPHHPFIENPSEGNARYLICLEDLHDSITVVPLTTQLKQQKHHPKSFVITKASTEGQLMQIPEDSLVIPEKTITIKKLSMYKHGHCSEEMLDRLNALCL